MPVVPFAVILCPIIPFAVVACLATPFCSWELKSPSADAANQVIGALVLISAFIYLDDVLLRS